MICPKCKSENSENAVFCTSCGFKLKTVCPKCKMTNKLNSPKCTNCGLRLIRFCPICQTPNSPISEKCKKCATPLLKKCKSCNALNPLSSTHCKKCAAVLEEKVAEYIPHSTLLIELTNGNILSEHIAKKELADKLIKKFFQTILTILKPHNLKALKVATYAIGVELDFVDEKKLVTIAKEIVQEFENLNEKLLHTNISFDVKVLVSQALSIKHKFGIDMLPRVQIGALCIDSPTANALKNEYSFKKVASGIFAIVQPEVVPAVSQQIPETFIHQEISQPQDIIEQQAQVQNLENVVLPEPEIVAPQEKEQPAAPTMIEPEVVPIEEHQQVPPVEPVSQPNPQRQRISPRKETVNSLKNLFEQKNGGFIAIVGESGMGKKTLLNLALAQVAEKNFCILQADCHTTLNTVPFATIQNLIRSMFSLPLINIDPEKIKTTMQTALPKNLGIQDEEVINTLINLLVPQPIENSDVVASKKKLVFAVRALFDAIKKFQKVVLMLKEVEFIDKSSAEIFDALFDCGFLDDAFLVTTTSNNSHISTTLHSDNAIKRNIGTFRALPFNNDELIEELSYYITNTNEIPQEILHQLQSKIRGWPLFFEEVIIFLNQSRFIYSDEAGIKMRTDAAELILPNTIEELIAVRLDLIFSQNELAHQIVANAVCMGYSFYPLIIQKVLGIDEATFAATIDIIVSNGFMVTHDNVNFKFKNKFVYDIIKNFVIKDEEQERQINANLLKIVMEMNHSNSSQTAEIAQKAQNFQEAYPLWESATKEALLVGDENLYILAQKRTLENIDYSGQADSEEQKLANQERIGIANYLTSPEDSIGFLSQAIQSYESQNNAEKVLELSAYLVKSLDLMGNTQEAIEYIDKSIEYIDPEKMPLELALLKFLKLKFLVESGYLGEVITLIQSEIMPSLQKSAKFIDDLTEKEFDIIEQAVLDSQLILIKALSLQGNKNYYNVLELFVNNNQNEKAQIEVFVIDAMHKALNGMPEESEVSIGKTRNIVRNASVDDKENIFLELDLISLLNKVLYNDDYNAAQEVSQIAQRARELSNSFVYNFIQLIFVKQLIANKDYSNAANMINDCLNYFASQKIALFAIPSWAILSVIQSALESYDEAISIAQQSLDVASKPQIQNNYFIASIKKLLSDYFMLKDDFEMAKMHLEEAIEFSKANDLLFFQGKLYLDLAKLYQKALESAENKQEHKNIIIKLLNTSKEIAISVESKFLQNKVEILQKEFETI